ncbi:MAG: hypothetical protein P8X63_13025 [Desulfuromonadaceae bacterium]
MMKNNAVRLGLLVTILVALLAYQNRNVFRQEPTEKPSTKALVDKSCEEGFEFVPFAGAVLIDQVISSSSLGGQGNNELDGMSYDELTSFRLAKVDEYRVLKFYHPGYHPFQGYHNNIYGRISEYQNWLNPATYFFSNPYLLIIPTQAPFVNPINLACPDVSILYQNGAIEETHSGASASCWFDAVYRSGGEPGTLWLFMVNAWDAGFFYAHVDVDQSENIARDASATHISNALHSRSYYYHVGQYDVNNISPRDPNAWVRLIKRNVKTQIHIKLWREKPEALDQPASLTYIIRIEPNGSE